MSSRRSDHPPADPRKKPLSFLRAYKHDIADLPEPGQRWIATVQQVRADDQDKFDVRYSDCCPRVWLHRGCIRSVGRVRVSGEGGGGRHVYQTVACNHDRAVELVRREDGPLPGCQHSGVSNSRDLPDGVVTCGRDCCDNTARKEDASW